MERALIIGSSGGIGAAVSGHLTQQGVEVTGLSRSGDGFELTEEAGIARALGALAAPFDLILCATGALEIDGHGPEKSLSQLSAAAMAAQFATNATGPAMVMKHALPLLPRQGRAVMAVLSARVGSIGDNHLGGWHSYRAAKAALNQVIRGAAIELGRTHPDTICIALHPGTVATPLTRKYLGRHPAVSPAEAAGNILSVLGGLGPQDSGGFFDWRGDRVEW